MIGNRTRILIDSKYGTVDGRRARVGYERGMYAILGEELLLHVFVTTVIRFARLVD